MMATSENAPADFKLFTSLRYDPILLQSKENQALSFTPDSSLYMPIYHRDRLLEAARYFAFDAVIPLLEDGAGFQSRIMDEIGTFENFKDHLDGPLKVKVTLDNLGDMSVDLAAVNSVDLQTLYPETLQFASWPPAEAAEALVLSPRTGEALTRGSTDRKPVEQYALARQMYTIHIDSKMTKQNAHTSLKTTWRSCYDASRARHVRTMQEEVLLQNEKGEITEGSLTTPYFFRNNGWVTPPVHDACEHGGQRGTTRRWALERGICAGEEVVREETVKNGDRVWVSNGVRGFGWGIVLKKQ